MVGIITQRLGPPGALGIAGLVCMAAAEWLILSRRHFWSGIEEALGVAGWTMMAFECWNRVDWSETSGARFVCAALAIAGLRQLNPLFTTLAVLAFVRTLGIPPLESGLVCYGIGTAALIVGGCAFRRPSHDLMLDWLVVVMPIAGYLWSTSYGSLVLATDYLHVPPSLWIVPLCLLAFAGAALATGLSRRAHAPIAACMLCMACAAFELRRLTALALEIKLIVWGCVLLLATVALHRYLREPRGGITSRRVREKDDFAGILGMAGRAVLTPASTPSTATSFAGGGGRFGGGGATDRY